MSCLVPKLKLLLRLGDSLGRRVNGNAVVSSFKFEHSDRAPIIQIEIRESQMRMAVNGDFRTSDVVSV